MESVYKVVEIIGTSDKSWEEAARVAVNTASKSLRDLRVAEVVEMDIRIEDGGLIFRVKMNVSFKLED
jgi:dodecin